MFGRKITNGDDAMWTRYAMLAGDTVFQRSAFGYTLHPEKMSFLRKQRLRWHRSYFWGNLWLLRNFSPRRMAWWQIAWDMTSFVWWTIAIPTVLVVAPLRTGQFAWMFFVWFTVLSYLSSLSYLTVQRPDMTIGKQLRIWLLAPINGLMNAYIGWALQYAGLVTCLATGWSTRGQIEVSLGGGVTTDPDETAAFALVGASQPAGAVSWTRPTVALPVVAGRD